MESQTYLYFAYGSNLNPERMRRRIPDARPVGRATLRGWRLVERLYADIEKARGGRVEGVLYLVTPTELRRLDAYEGYPNVYNCVKVIVHAELMGNRATRYRIPAFTYAMTPATRKARDGKPYPADYRIVCATGARYWGLPNAFGTVAPKKKEHRRWFTLGGTYPTSCPPTNYGTSVEAMSDGEDARHFAGFHNDNSAIKNI